MGRSGSGFPASEVLFLSSGGKAGMHKLARALRAVGVAVVASPDLDILNDRAVFRTLVEAMGGNWHDFDALYTVATREFERVAVPATCADVLIAIDAVLRNIGSEPWTEEGRLQLLPQMRTAKDSWSELKQYGVSAFKSGPARHAADQLLRKLHELGVVPVRVGELERFAPALEVGKGSAWLPAALVAGAPYLPRGSRARTAPSRSKRLGPAVTIGELAARGRRAHHPNRRANTICWPNWRRRHQATASAATTNAATS